MPASDGLAIPRRPGGRAAALVSRWALRLVALAYLGLLLAAPLALVFWNTFEDGVGVAWEAVTTDAALHALWLTLLITAIAVPLNTVFGVAAALILVRRRVPGRPLVNALIDLPLALSPVVVGLAILLVWGRTGWFGPAAEELGVQVVFALPGMVLATVFVCLPFVVREVVPVLREVGADQEEAASTLGAGAFATFRRITLPAIRWGVVYGVVLTTARALGEYGAVRVVSGGIAGRTETLTLHVEERFQGFDYVAAYGSSVVLAILALAVVLVMNLLNRKGGGGGDHGH
ncbi:sulfate ABC transporter permease [Miltoncostaea marina]|uniref:sulfate ABC transporter permease n=1 Tax=Miltoncostaea marina TaxID=2843215 RepID=UPI001C3E861C|nr:sulfate ABC transporter permease subunit [Miltoncostaea marina]